MKLYVNPKKDLIIRRLHLLRNVPAQERIKWGARYIKQVKELILEGQLDENLNLTKKSLLRIFKEQNHKQIQDFRNDIIRMGFNPIIFELYLESVDYSNRTIDILDIFKFNSFYEQIEKNPIKGLLYYQPLTDNHLFDFNHMLSGCHPNQALVNNYVTTEEPEIKAITDWQVNQDKYAKANKLDIINPNNGIDLVIDHLKKERKALLAKKRNDPRHLVIIESLPDNLFARGIVKLDDYGFSYVYNPEYQKRLTK